MDVKRSWMFVPSHRRRFVDKAMTLGCDVVMLDLEDGVPPDEKPAARELAAEALGRPKKPGGPAWFVRINAVGHEPSEADIAAVVASGAIPLTTEEAKIMGDCVLQEALGGSP